MSSIFKNITTSDIRASSNNISDIGSSVSKFKDLHIGGIINPGGSLPLPNLTTVQRDALTPSSGTTIFNTTLDTIQYYTGSTWVSEVKPLSLFNLQLNTDTAEQTSITGLTGTIKWQGGVLAPNGKIYCIPYSSTNVLIIDPATDIAEQTSITGLTGGNKWYGGVLAPNGKIYCVPYAIAPVLIISPNGLQTVSTDRALSAYYNKL